MRNARFMLLVLLSSLLVLNGCSRRDILDDYPVSGVEISLNWDGVTPMPVPAQQISGNTAKKK